MISLRGGGKKVISLITKPFYHLLYISGSVSEEKDILR